MRKRIALQLDMMRELDKPYIQAEALYKNILDELKNIKWIRSNSQYVNYSELYKVVIYSEYSAILSDYTDILSGLGRQTLKYRHNDSFYYDRLSVDPDYLSVTEVKTKEDMYIFTKRSFARISGLILANEVVLRPYKDKIDNLKLIYQRMINKLKYDL